SESKGKVKVRGGATACCSSCATSGFTSGHDGVEFMPLKDAISQCTMRTSSSNALSLGTRIEVDICAKYGCATEGFGPVAGWRQLAYWLDGPCCWISFP